MHSKQLQKHILNSTSEICKFLKNYNARAILVKLENGDVEGTLKAVEKMNQSNKKITNQDLVNLIVDMKKDMNQRFEGIDKRLDGIDKRLDKMDAKIDLMIQAPTMNREIDHDALAKIDVS